MNTPRAPLQVAPAFVRYAQATWPAEHAPRIALFEAFERGAIALGLQAEHLAIGMSYWLALMARHPEVIWHAHSSAATHAAALFIAVELQHTTSPISAESAALAFALDEAQLDTLPAIVDSLAPLIARIPAKQATTHLREVRDVERAHDAALARQRFELLWKTPADTRSLAGLATADFGMILEMIEVDEILARSLPYAQTPTHLMLASSDRHEHALATIPWFGPISPTQRIEALRTLLTVASLKPDGLDPARPLILFLPSQADVDAMLTTPGIKGMAIATHAALATHMKTLERMRKRPRRRKK